MDDYVRIVLESHPSARSAQALDASAAAASKAARLLPDPTLELSLGEGRAADGSGSPKTEKGFSVSQSIPWLPARSASIEAADHEARALRAEGLATRWGLELDARVAYYRLLFARAQVEVDRASEEDARSLLDLMTRRASLGEAREVDRIKARVEWLRQDRELSAAYREELAAEGILRTLAGEPLPTPLRLAGELPRHTDAHARPPRRAPRRPRAKPGADPRPRRGRPRRVAPLERPPRRASRTSASPSSARRSSTARPGAAPSASSLPLWNARRGDVARAEAESRLRAADAERDPPLAPRRPRDTPPGRRDARRPGRLARGRLPPSAAESLRLARLLFEEGETSLLDLLDAQRTARDARREEIRARFELAVAISELQRLLGPNDDTTGDSEDEQEARHRSCSRPRPLRRRRARRLRQGPRCRSARRSPRRKPPRRLEEPAIPAARPSHRRRDRRGRHHDVEGPGRRPLAPSVSHRQRGIRREPPPPGRRERQGPRDVDSGRPRALA